MAEAIKQAEQKKSVKIPNTDTSLDDDKSTRKFVYLMIALIILMIIVGGVILYWMIGRYVQQTNKNKAQDETISLLETKKTNLELLKPNYEKVLVPVKDGKSQAELILNAMPTSEDFREFVAMIENMSQKSGVKVTSLTKPGSEEGGQTPQVVVTNPRPLPPKVKSSLVTIPIEGSFDNVLNFLRETEKSSRVMDFVSMEIDSLSGTVSVSPTFTIYWQDQANISPTEKELK